MRRVALALLLMPALLLLTANEGAERAAASSGIVATFVVVDETFRAHIENPATIEQVLALQQGQSSATIPIGTLRLGTEYNTGWSWHIDPWEVEMAEITIELCDGRPSFVEADLDYWLNVVGMYCPWNAVLVDVLFLGDPVPTPTSTPLAVGGIAELPEVSTASAANRSFGLHPGVVFGLAAGGAAGASLLALAGTARYLSRSRGD